MEKEICYIILGKQRPRLTRGKLVKKTTGNSHSVKFDWDWVLKREEQKGDVIGFWHTHPDGNTKPSKRDRKTMEAWINCFGKSLYCVIQNNNEIAYRVTRLQPEDPKWKYRWSREPLVYKIFRRFGIRT